MMFDSWSGLARVLVVEVCAYAALVLMLRICRKRTLSTINLTQPELEHRFVERHGARPSAARPT